MADSRAFNTPEAVRDLGRALDRYVRDATEGIGAVSRVETNAQAKIAEAVERGRGKVYSAQKALEYCETQPREEGEGSPDCSGQARALEAAVEALGVALEAQAILSASCAEYRPSRARYERAITTINLDSQKLLNEIARDLDRYLRSAAASGTAQVGKFGLSTSGSVPASVSMGSLFGDGGETFSMSDGGGGGGGSFGGGSDSGSFSLDVGTNPDNEATAGLPPLVTPPGFPDGYAMVPVAEVPESELADIEPGAFKLDCPPDDLKWGIDALFRVVVPALRLGKDQSYFEQRDANEGRYGNRSYTSTYLGFFGADESIYVDRAADGSFHVGNGRHRIWLARQLGIDALPAHVSQ